MRGDCSRRVPRSWSKVDAVAQMRKEVYMGGSKRGRDAVV